MKSCNGEKMQNTLLCSRGAARWDSSWPGKAVCFGQSPWMRNLRPGRPKQVAQCETLRKHGDAGAKACYQRLVDLQGLAIRPRRGVRGLSGGQQTLFRRRLKARPRTRI